MKQIFTYFFLLFFSTYNAQFKDYESVIGFACGATGSSTTLVIKFYTLLSEKKYEQVKSKIYSNNSAENFLSVIISEKLAKKNLIKFSKTDKITMTKLYNSEKEVEICGGCTFDGFIKLSELLNNTHKEKIRNEADFFLKEFFD